MISLYVKAGADAGKTFQIAEGTTSIGRSMENDIILNDAATSRAHAQILTRENKYYIRDLNSTHGTFVNEVRNNHEMLLGINDIIRIGNCELLFQVESDSGTSPGVVDRHKPILGPDQDPLTLEGGETIAFRLSAEDTASETALSENHTEMFSRVAKAIQSIFDLDNLLSVLMDMLFEVFEPDRGMVLLREKDDQPLQRRVARPDENFKVSHTVIDHAISERMSLLIGDIAEDQRFAAAQSIITQSIQSAICAPLLSKNRVLGVIYLDSKANQISYQKEDLALLNIIAANAAISIENAILVQEKLEAERLAAIGVAIAGISHYVKNILTGIRGTSQLIETGLKKNNSHIIKEAWPILQRSTTKISTLVQDMLTYSKKRTPDLQKGNLNSILKEVAENQKERAESAQVALLLKADPQLPNSEFDAKALYDTMLNLVGNAIEACSEVPEGQVQLLSRTEGKDQVVLEVQDNGPGIPIEIQRKIFEPFFSTKGSKGTGLGLACAKKTIAEHLGALTLEPTQGEGTTFRIQMPIHPQIEHEED